jgi:hypothetical protein
MSFRRVFALERSITCPPARIGHFALIDIVNAKPAENGRSQFQILSGDSDLPSCAPVPLLLGIIGFLHYFQIVHQPISAVFGHALFLRPATKHDAHIILKLARPQPNQINQLRRRYVQVG